MPPGIDPEDPPPRTMIAIILLVKRAGYCPGLRILIRIHDRDAPRQLKIRLQSLIKVQNSLGLRRFHFAKVIKNTAGTGRSPPLSLGCIVSLPLTSIQLLPPPSMFIAS